MEKKNIFWLSGDRYICIERKKKIVKNFLAKGNWELTSFTCSDINSFFGKINTNSIINDKNQIFVHNGSIPNVQKNLKRVLNLSKNKALIVIEGNPEKISHSSKPKFHAKIKQYLEHYEPMIGKNTFVNKSAVPTMIKFIKKITKSKISNENVEEILKHCKYNTGSTINIINQIALYKGNNEITKKDIEKNFITFEDNRIESVIKGLSIRDIHVTMDAFEMAIEESNFDKLYMLYFSAIIEYFTLVMYCRLAIDSGVRGESSIGDFVSDKWIKKGQNVNPYSISTRYQIYKEQIDNMSLKESLWILQLANEAIEKFISGKFPTKYIVGFFVKNACIKEV
jgi:hypothetical protein